VKTWSKVKILGFLGFYKNQKNPENPDFRLTVTAEIVSFQSNQLFITSYAISGCTWL